MGYFAKQTAKDLTITTFQTIGEHGMQLCACCKTIETLAFSMVFALLYVKQSA